MDRPLRFGRIHAVGARRAFAASARARRPQRSATEPRDCLLAHDLLPADLRDVWSDRGPQALDGVARCFERAGDVRRCACMATAMPATCCGPTHGPHFVDFDDARTGPAVQDLWMLLSGDRAEMERQLAVVLAGYEDFLRRSTGASSILSRRCARCASSITRAWIARRWDDPAFPAAFPWFNTQRYWQDRILELREQVALMDEPPLEAA